MAPRPSSRASTSSSTTGRRECIRRPSRSGLSPSPPSWPRPHGPPAGLCRPSRRRSSPGNDDEPLVLASACPVVLYRLRPYPRDPGDRAALWAVRLQGRDVAQFTILATVRRLLTFNMSTDIL